MDNWIKNLGLNFYRVGKALAKRRRGDTLLAGYRTWKGEPEVRA